MSLFKKKDEAVKEAPAAAETVEAVSAADVEEVMKKYDRESNTRIWVGVPQKIVRYIMALFSLYCIYSTLASNASLEVRLMIFLGCVVVMGFLYYPASKNHVTPNKMP